MSDTTAIATIGPQHHGTRMTLEEFARIEGEPGHLYELEKGVILVVDVPGLPHGLLVQAIRNPLVAYQIAHPDKVFFLAEGGGAALRLPGMQSERHPDLLVYLSEPPVDDEQPWEYWVPDIVVEVVSAESMDRDYRVKREEYLQAGVRLYWIVDAASQTVTALTRRTDSWREQRLNPPAVLKTRILPGFELSLSDIFKPRR